SVTLHFRAGRRCDLQKGNVASYSGAGFKQTLESIEPLNEPFAVIQTIDTDNELAFVQTLLEGGNHLRPSPRLRQFSNIVGINAHGIVTDTGRMLTDAHAAVFIDR